jgi:hypothetical protein
MAPNRRTRALIRARNQSLRHANYRREGWNAALMWFFGIIPGYSIIPREQFVIRGE